jgi:hypothetical protein
LELGFDYVTMRDLAASFEILADAQKMLGLIAPELGSRVLPLSIHQAVIGLRDSNDQSPVRDLHTGACDSFLSRCSLHSYAGHGGRRNILMKGRPLPIDVDTIVGNISPGRELSVALGVKVL